MVMLDDLIQAETDLPIPVQRDVQHAPCTQKDILTGSIAGFSVFNSCFNTRTPSLACPSQP